MHEQILEQTVRSFDRAPPQLSRHLDPGLGSLEQGGLGHHIADDIGELGARCCPIPALITVPLSFQRNTD